MSVYDFAPQQDPQETLLDQLLADAAPALGSMQGPPPQSFLEGLARGAVGGLASRGERVAKQRALFQQRQMQRQAAVDQARIAAAGRASDFANRQQLSQEEFNRANPELTPADIAAFPAGTAGSRLTPGTRLPLAERAKLMGEETPAAKQANIKAEAKARAEGTQAGEVNSTVMDDGTLGLLADRELAGGETPNLGRGKNGEANRARYYEIFKQHATEQGLTGADIAGSKASFQANKSSQASLQKLYDASTAWATTAEKNTAQAEQRLRKIVDTGSPWINRPLRSINRNVLGSADQAAFDAAIKTIIPEYARLLSSPSGTGVLSDNARKEAESILNDSHSVAQILATLDVLKSDAKNRRDSYSSQLRDVKWRIAHPGKERPTLADFNH